MKKLLFIILFITSFILMVALHARADSYQFTDYTGAQMAALFDTVDAMSANGASLTAAANYAAMRALLDLEPATDFYSIAAANAAFLEATQLDDTKGNGDTTYLWSADKIFDQLALKAPLASPTFTGTVNLADAIVAFDKKLYFGDTGIYIWADDDGILDIVSDTTIESSAAWVHTGNFTATTYGAAAVTDTELGYLDTVSSNIQDQLDNVVPGTGTEDHLARWDAANALQDSLVVVNDAGAMTGLTSMTVDASATPGVTGYDSDVSGDDVWKIYGSATDADDSVMYFQVEQGDALVTYMTFDGVGETVDLAKPLDMGANAITSTGTIDTTGLTTGGVKTVVDADGGDPDAYCYGGVWFASGTGEIDLPPVAAGMQLTVENHTANDVHIDPDASEVIRLNGVALTGGFRIIGTDLGDGCVLTYYSAGVWSAFCSGYADAGS